MDGRAPIWPSGSAYPGKCSDTRQVELRRQVQDREIFVVTLRCLRQSYSPEREMIEQVEMRPYVPVEVHRHERGELDKAGVDAPPGAGKP